MALSRILALKIALLVFVLSSIVLLVFLLRNVDINVSARNRPRNVGINESFARNERKTFVYLTQTEQCLPSNLASSAQIGDRSTCNCDVIVLSYRKECKEDRPPHLTYLLNPQTSWASGRNVLFVAAMNRTPGYHYYVFHDDDVILKFNSFTPQAMRQLQPFRVVESWLLDYEPAVGVLDYESHNGAKVVLERRQRLCDINETSLVLPTVFFDGIFNAFHHKAVEHILPYPTRYDKETWYGPQKYILSAAELKFRGQTLLFAPVTAGNPKHRPYVKSLKHTSEMWRGFIEEIRQGAPAIYKNRSGNLFERYDKELMGYVEKSPTYCMKVKRHHSIEAYAHFEFESLTT